MNCLEFRRLLLTDPRTALADADAAGHRQSCPSCASHAMDAAAFERALEDAVRVPVDPALAERVVLNYRLGVSRWSRRRAIAAGLAVAAGAGAILSLRGTRPDPIADAAIRHVLGEPQSFAARQRVGSDELAAALAHSGAFARDGVADAVSYLHDCPVPGGWGKHFVLWAPGGRFTLITMPNCPSSTPASLERSGLHARVAPARSGAFAVVAESRQALEVADRFVAANIDWRVSR